MVEDKQNGDGLNEIEMKPVCIKVQREEMTVPPIGSERVIQTQPICYKTTNDNVITNDARNPIASSTLTNLPPLTAISASTANDAHMTLLSPYDANNLSHSNTSDIGSLGRFRVKKQEALEEIHDVNNAIHFVSGSFTTANQVATNDMLQTAAQFDISGTQHIPPPIYVQMQNGTIQALPPTAAAQLAINNIANLPQVSSIPSYIIFHEYGISRYKN